jgi:transcriptional regulator with XRE-family HTH domain
LIKYDNNISFWIVKEPLDLRKTLSINIRTARENLHITQARLAEYAHISLPYMANIEYCKTWVSDKTLTSIARALNMEAYELLRPQGGEADASEGKTGTNLHQITELVSAKKKTLKKAADESLDDLIQQIIKLSSAD